MTGYEVTSAAALDAIVSGVLDPLAKADGFESAGRRRWIRSHAPIRHLVEVYAAKGAQYLPRWGVSLDFVPHLKGGSLAWHRTNKSAMLDLWFSSVEPLDAIDSLHGPDGTRRDAERVLPNAWNKAMASFENVHDVASVLERAEWLRAAHLPNGWRFENYTQQPLAYALLLARCGSRERAMAALDVWIRGLDVEHLRENLTALVASAR